MRATILDLDPATYTQHVLHSAERDWAETNCYVDVCIELLHGLGYEPMAVLPFTVGIDFEGDQWTFFKPPLGDLYDLYGVDVQELAVWSSLTDQVEEQVRLGRPVLVEMDSFFLPDTAGTAYQTEHVKTTVAVVDIDVQATEMGYFHGQGFYRVGGSDFVRLFHLDPEHTAPDWMPPYVELMKLHRGPVLTGADLVNRSVELLKTHWTRRPEQNPVRSFRTRFNDDLAALREQPLDVFHKYSFATLRQAGACYELTARYLEWLINHGHEDFRDAQTHFRALSTGPKMLQFKLARVMGRKKDIDLDPPFDDLEGHWEAGMRALGGALG